MLLSVVRRRTGTHGLQKSGPVHLGRRTVETCLKVDDTGPNHPELRSQNLMFTECRENKFLRERFFHFYCDLQRRDERQKVK